MKKIIKLLLVLSIFIGYIPKQEVHAEENPFAGKTISILGDSISTYKNYSSGTAANTTNSTIKNNAVYYSGSNYITNVNQTWWKRTADELGMNILVNNSWSGSCLLSERAGTVGAYVERAVQMHDNTGDNAGEEPDIIAIYLGTNDFSYYKSTLGTYEDVKFDELISKTEEGYIYQTPTTSVEAYAIVLHKMIERYPNSEIYCFTLLPRLTPTASQIELAENFNQSIKDLAAHYQVNAVDLYEDSGITSDQLSFDTYLGDNRVHPGQDGMKAISNTFLDALMKNHVSKKYEVTYDLNHVFVKEGTRKYVQESYQAELVTNAGYDLDVKVFMNEEDITNQALKGNQITIDKVTGNIHIIANTVKKLETFNFTWSNELFTSKNNSTSKVSDGIFKLGKEIVLKHNENWGIDFKSKGSSSMMILSSSQSSSQEQVQFLYKSASGKGLMAIGQYLSSTYHNVGVALANKNIDWTAEHTYSIRNVVSENSNVLQLYVDHKYVGNMSEYYHAGTNYQNTSDDHLAGKDFIFRFIGANGGFKILKDELEYLTVYETNAPSIDDEVEENYSEYHFEYQNHELTSNTNPLTKVEDGVYKLNESIQLNYLNNWGIDFKSKGSSRMMILANDASSSKDDVQYFYKSTEGKGLFAFGQRISGTYHNYGLALSNKNIDSTQEHVYSIRNVVSGNTNVIQLYVDYEYVGNMSEYYLAGSNYQNTSDTYLAQKNFEFSYIGATGNFKVIEGELEYLHVYETNAPVVEPKPKEYIFEFSNNEFEASNNKTTKVSDGIFKLEKPIYLKQGASWAVEWKETGNRSMMVLATHSSPVSENAQYIYKSTSGSGLIAMGERLNSTYHNYGYAVNSIGIDVKNTHIYRIQNEVLENGNVLHLFVDNQYVGIMNQYYIGGTQFVNSNNAYLFNSDYIFNYIGSSSFAISKDNLEYLHVWEDNYTKGVFLEQGTIGYANGLNRDDLTRLRTKNYLKLSEFEGVSITDTSTLTNFVYDENFKYLGSSNWLGGGVSFTTKELIEKYPTGVYFKFAIKALDEHQITTNDLQALNLKVYGKGEKMPIPSNLLHEAIGNIGSYQDGAIHNGKLFVLNDVGNGNVFDLNGNKRKAFKLDVSKIKPHANSVSFSELYYDEKDEYPLLYVNVYNNYAQQADRKEGMVCVYRIIENETEFIGQLVQVIQIGFVDDLNLWKSKENNGDVRPYGNFVVDTDKNQLVAYVMRDANKTTRFFTFDLPKINEGVYDSTLGCNLVTLEESDIIKQFDVTYFNYLQGGCYSNGNIISVEGFGNPATLRVINLEKEKVIITSDLRKSNLTKEPEVICNDPDTNDIYFANADGILRKIYFDSSNCEHHYISNVIPSIGLTLGFTVYTCEYCLDTYQVNTIDKSYFEGKKLVTIGDSITAGVSVTLGKTDYTTVLGSLLKMNTASYGVGGRVLCTGGHRVSNIEKLTYENIKGADIVTIFLGVNDWDHARITEKGSYYTLGDFNSTDSSTIYGAMRMWCEKIEELKQMPGVENTQFYFMTPLITSWNLSINGTKGNWNQSKTNIHGMRLRDICNVIIEMANIYGHQAIDLNIVSGLYYIDENNNTLDLYGKGNDGIHPKESGHVQIASAMLKHFTQAYLNEECVHDYTPYITTTYPTCTKIGEEKHVCKQCGKTEARNLEMLDHEFITYISDNNATYLEDGTKSSKCEHCDAIDTIVDEGTKVLLGDIDGNGKVNTLDRMILSRHLAQWSGYETINTKAADVNLDGQVNAQDRMILARHLAKWQDYENLPYKEKTIYYDFKGTLLNVISRYSENSDIRVQMNKRGPNSIFDFTRFYIIEKSDEKLSNNIQEGQLFLASGTDCRSPFQLKALHNIDGDNLNENGSYNNYFTGGNHGYQNIGTVTPENSATGRTGSVFVFADGKEVVDSNGYASELVIYWENYIQACNTTKQDGSGREVLKEIHKVSFDGTTWYEEIQLIPLEEINIYLWYGLQFVQVLPTAVFNEKVIFKDTINQIEEIVLPGTSQTSSSKTFNEMILQGEKHEVKMTIDANVGLGKGEMNSKNHSCFTTNYGKVYFNMINGTNIVDENDCLSLKGSYTFYPHK